MASPTINRTPPLTEFKAREAALEILKEIEEKGVYLNLVLNRLLSRQSFPGAERTLLTELSYGVIQRLNTLDWVITLYLTHPLEKLTPGAKHIKAWGLPAGFTWSVFRILQPSMNR